MASGNDPWWIVPRLMPTGRGDVQQFVPVQSATRPAGAISGPYATEQDAEHAVIAHNAAPIPLPNPLSGIEEVGAVLKAFFTTVADWHFWASLGWILLGAMLLVMGVRLWLGKPALPSAPPIVPIPV